MSACGKHLVPANPRRAVPLTSILALAGFWMTSGVIDEALLAKRADRLADSI